MKTLHPAVEVLGKYQQAKIPVECRCSVCGYEWSARPLNLTFERAPTGCPRCSGRKLKTADEFAQDLDAIHPHLEIVGEYKNSHTPLCVRCTKHNVSWSAAPTNLLRRSSTGCPACAQERTDSALADQLKRYCLAHFSGTVLEYRVLKNPVTGRWLPYDIYIPNLNGEDVYCEVMGNQHYGYVPYLHGTVANYQRQLARDDYKERYANQHGRYVAIDITKVRTVQDALPLLSGEHLGWVARQALALDDTTEVSSLFLESVYEATSQPQ